MVEADHSTVACIPCTVLIRILSNLDQQPCALGGQCYHGQHIGPKDVPRGVCGRGGRDLPFFGRPAVWRPLRPQMSVSEINVI